MQPCHTAPHLHQVGQRVVPEIGGHVPNSQPLTGHACTESEGRHLQHLHIELAPAQQSKRVVVGTSRDSQPNHPSQAASTHNVG